MACTTEPAVTQHHSYPVCRIAEIFPNAVIADGWKPIVAVRKLANRSVQPPYGSVAI
jgi:hypothetical protein